MLLRAAVFALACLPAVALGWGDAGHRIVGELAERQLTPGARAAVAALLIDEADPTLAGVAKWADDVRGSEAYGYSRPWHYVNFDSLDCEYLPERHCPNGDCIVAAIARQAAVLGDYGYSRQQRAEALKFVVHFVGDVHQPMHAGLRADRGGNNTLVDFRQRQWNLHAIWDFAILDSHQPDWRIHVEELAPRPWGEDGPPTDFAPLAWALESCRAIRARAIYPPEDQRLIGRDYLERHRPFAELRLRQAGARLAALLNATLDPGRPDFD